MASRKPSFIQSNTHPAEDVRLTVLSGLITNPGVVNSGDLAVSANGTPNMSVNVAAGGAWIKGSETSTQGMYGLYSDSTQNVSIATSDPTNPRVDIIVYRVRDAAYSGSFNDGPIVAITGTPSGSPVAPAAPNSSITLAQVSVAANAGSIVAGNITDKRPRAAAPGARVTCTSTSRPAAPWQGLEIYETDTTKVQIWSGSAWIEMGNHGTWTTYTPTWSGTLGNGTLLGAYQRFGGTVAWRILLTWGSTTSHPASNQTLTLPVNIWSTLGTFPVGRATAALTGASLQSAGDVIFSSSTNVCLMFGPVASGAFNQAFWSNTFPQAWATGSTLYASGTYPV